MLIVGVIEMSLAIPLWLGIVPPNTVYGVRTEKTLSNKELWYKVNKYSGRDFALAGVVLVVISLVLLRRKIGINAYIAVPLILCQAALIVVRAMVYTNKVSEQV